MKIYENYLPAAEERRVIVPMQYGPTYDLRSCEWVKENGVCVFNGEIKNDGTKLYKNLVGKMDFGKVLVQSPYDTDCYDVINPEDPNGVLHTHVLQKLDILRTFCMYLGAVYVKIVYREVEKNKEVTKMTTEMPETPESPDIDATIVKGWIENEHTNYQMLLKMEDIQPDIEGAEKYLKETNLDADSEFANVLKRRAISLNNPRANYMDAMNISLVKNSANILNIVAKVKFKEFKISSTFTRLIEEKKNTWLSVEIHYGREFERKSNK
ncbi:MAG: hypothetical protein FWC26_02225 [Fibromonadales bacterium]|nr:hypothetical protein [Fibromonadales bacterium]